MTKTKAVDMRDYNTYIMSLRNACVLVDLNEQQCFLKTKFAKDTSFISPYKGLERQLQRLSNDDCANWLNDSVTTDSVSTILAEWDEQIDRLGHMIKVLGSLDKKQRSEGLPEKMRDCIHRIYQTMEWHDIQPSLEEIDPLFPRPGQPEPPYEDELAKQDKAAFAAAYAENTIAAYERYLKRVGIKKYQAAAEQAIVGLKAAAKEEEEEELWKTALAQDSVVGYSHYKKKSQLNKYLSEADAAIKRLQGGIYPPGPNLTPLILYCSECGSSWPDHYPRCLKCGGKLVQH
ncbi:MAG: hypothetical protein ACYC4A_05860 [Desulfobulbia bacterium]